MSKLRVLITGAGGTLGTLLAPRLAQAGHEPVLFDLRHTDLPYESFRGDVRCPEDLAGAMQGVDYVIHLAALLGIQSVPAREFYAVNLTGTFNVWEAAAAAGVRGLVFSSTMSVYKPHDQSLKPDAVTVMSEDTPARPRDLYGYTKAAGEELCRLYGHSHGIPSIALRYGMFSPEPFFPYGIRLLYGGVDARDVADANVAAMGALASGKVGWDVFNVESVVPFNEEDAPQLLRDPMAALEKYWPGSADLLGERGVERLTPIHEIYPIHHLSDVLGVHPKHSFEGWLEELRDRPEERATKNPPWP
jgi:UDP-glucose 4-epimerase